MKISLPSRSGENKKTFFILQSVALLLFFLVAGFITCHKSSADDAPDSLIISEVLVGGNSASEEFIELYNPSESEIDLEKMPLALHIVNSKNSDSAKDLNFINGTIGAKSYYLIASKDYASDSDNKTDPDVTYSASLVADGAVYISTSKNKKEDVIDYLGWGSNDYFSDHVVQNPDSKKSLERTALNGNNWQVSCDPGGTPGKENLKDENCDSGSGDNNNGDNDNNNNGNQDKESKYAGQVKINEIYPAPNTGIGEKEFVEITNTSDDSIDFSTWCLKDQVEYAKGNKGSCKKIGDQETKGIFTVFYGTFSLNNDSKGDTVYLSDKDNTLVDSRTYSSTKAQQSYAFDGSAWRWTSQPTPGAENQFDKVPKIKIQKDDPVYKDMYAYFSVDVEDQNKNTKFTWDFGDSHKSYLQDTKHKYAKTGTYAASLRVHDGKVDETLDFEVDVEKYKAPKIRIVSFSPNPKGSDTDNEWIEIENNSKKKINLKGWSIATGWEIFYNHPIRTDFKIKPGQTEKLTRDICAFTLANTKDKIKLRSPDGKAIQEITYDHGKKTIAEDELYQKNKDSWVWITPQKTTDLGGLQKQTSEVVARAPATSEQKLNTSITEIQAALGKYSAAPDEKKKLATRNDLVNYNLAVKFNLNAASPRVAGMATIRDISQPEKHWLVSWLDELWMEINSALNHLLNAA